MNPRSPILVFLLSLFLLACGDGAGGTCDAGDGGGCPTSTTAATTGATATSSSSAGPVWIPCTAPLPFGTSPSCNVANVCNALTPCPSFQFCDTRPELGQCADPYGCPQGTCYLQGHVGDPCLLDAWCLEACGLGCDANSYTCVVVDPAKAATCPP